MTEIDLSEIEVSLKITLPKMYRNMMLTHSAELKKAGCFNESLSTFFLDHKEVISINKLERPKESGTGCAFPQWWKTFVLVGTNGAGDYYCLRLDNKPGVWMIGSDCGDEPTRIAESLKSFVDKLMKEHKEQQEQAAKRQEAIQEEETEELQAAAAAADLKTKQWLAASSPYLMFQYLDNLGRKVSPRKLRLFGIACCRRLENLTADDECARAVLLAEQMVNGAASPEEVARLRARLKSKYLAIVAGEEGSQAGLWGVGAAKNLLQDDTAYIRDAPISAGDADLLGVWNSANSAASGAEGQAQADLLREVLGNPFHPVRYEPRWWTQAVIELARSIYESQAFHRMPGLAEALMGAGCDDQRILKHCRRNGGHVPGCWVLDLILGSEPEPREEEFTWDFKWEHPKIEARKLKQRLQAFGINAPGDAKLVDEKAALAFADWLDKNGDTAWARYVHVRCALDEKTPAEDYPDLFEQCFESGATMRPGRADFEGFYFSGHRFANDEWWSDDTDDMLMGLPSFVNAVTPGRGAGPALHLIKRLDALIRNTPVRGVDFQEHYPKQMAEILNSQGARHLRWMAFCNRPDKGQTGPVIEALVKSPFVRTLERLRIDDGIKSGDALALAEATFERLRRLDLPAYCGMSCSAMAVARLLTAPWFRKLQQLHTGFSEECCETGMRHLAGMVDLHTLALCNLPDRQILALERAAEFPGLRRLCINGANLSGKYCEAFCQLQAPQLIELCLRALKAKTADIRTLVASPLFDNLRALSIGGLCFGGPKFDEASIELVAGSPCASKLRILRLHCGDSDLVGSFHSLSGTPLTRQGAFPAITTLQIEFPYAKKAKRDAADFLKRLAIPRLRHLTLSDCDFDDQCADALATSPTFANLSRLKIHQGYHATKMLTRKAAGKLFRASNLQRLVELEFHNFALGKALDVLTDESILPKLGSASFWGSNAPSQTIERLKTKRPMIHVGS